MPKTQLLTNITVDRVDVVDEGANAGAKIALFKRKGHEDIVINSTTEVDALVSSVLASLRKDYGTELLLDPGSNVQITITPDPAQTFEDVIADAEAEDYAGDLLIDIQAANDCLRESVCSILSDDEVSDKQKMLEQTFGEYHQHLESLISDGVEKAIGLAKAANHEGEGAMTEAELTKKISDTVAAALPAEVAKATKAKDEEIAKLKEDVAKQAAEVAFNKMSDEHKKAAGAMSDAEKSKFSAMTADEREAHLKKSIQTLPEEVRKKLDEFEEIKKDNAIRKEREEVSDFAKRAVNLGLAEAEGEILRKAYKGDVESIKKLEEKIKGLNEQVKKGSLFKNFGTEQGGNPAGGAMAQLIAKRDVVKQAEPKLSDEQAFAKVYADPANKELVAQEKSERLHGQKAA